MALRWKLVVDAGDPATLADFWAAALEYRVEDQTAFIEQLLAAGRLGPDLVAEHNGGKHFRGLVGIRHPDDPVDAVTGIGQGRRILFQQVPEPKTVKNRLHLDIHGSGSPGGLDDLVARLEGLGAVRVEEFDQGPAGHWWVMRDVEGNEFCAA